MCYKYGIFPVIVYKPVWSKMRGYKYEKRFYKREHDDIIPVMMLGSVESLAALGRTQLRADILETPATGLVHELGTLEHKLRHGPRVFEWRSNVFG